MRIVVVFPAPFGPSKPYISPGATFRSTPSTATLSPNRRTRPSARIASPPSAKSRLMPMSPLSSIAPPGAGWTPRDSAFCSILSRLPEYSVVTPISLQCDPPIRQVVDLRGRCYELALFDLYRIDEQNGIGHMFSPCILELVVHNAAIVGGRDRPISPWSRLVAKTADKHPSSRPNFGGARTVAGASAIATALDKLVSARPGPSEEEGESE